eukprot:CAMPEP_0182879246 /NCGR_PEP_ID=MMETSP0034_2-20130328/15854_1 /TAXON_ID=156128 /ORGANISM="Nephroselmis pyriformis, Strain CCMP717" /LENGTH=312 /DNA_ID=CAMNT_0025012171 /DNA_START=3 /DNA_END=938 /DNA_ORIENTATION=+
MTDLTGSQPPSEIDFEYDDLPPCPPSRERTDMGAAAGLSGFKRQAVVLLRLFPEDERDGVRVGGALRSRPVFKANSPRQKNSASFPEPLAPELRSALSTSKAVKLRHGATYTVNVSSTVPLRSLKPPVHFEMMQSGKSLLEGRGGQLFLAGPLPGKAHWQGQGQGHKGTAQAAAEVRPGVLHPGIPQPPSGKEWKNYVARWKCTCGWQGKTDDKARALVAIPLDLEELGVVRLAFPAKTYKEKEGGRHREGSVLSGLCFQVCRQMLPQNAPSAEVEDVQFLSEAATPAFIDISRPPLLSSSPFSLPTLALIK